MKTGIRAVNINVAGGPSRPDDEDYSGKLGRARHAPAALLRHAERSGRRLAAARRRADKSARAGAKSGGANAGTGGLDLRVAGLSYGLGRTPTAVTRTRFRLNGPGGGGLSRRGQPLAEHIVYLARPEAQVRPGEAVAPAVFGAVGTTNGPPSAPPAGVFFDAAGGLADPSALPSRWRGDRHHWRVIVSPERGAEDDLRGFARGFVGRVEARLGTPLEWAGACHFNTATPHAHLLIRGLWRDGRDLLMTRDFIAGGLRAEAGAELLARSGPRSEASADAALTRMAGLTRPTPLDDLLAGIAARSLGGGAFRLPADWLPELAGRHHLRERLLALEGMGLATREGDRPFGWGDARPWALAPDWRERLSRLAASPPTGGAVGRDVVGGIRETPRTAVAARERKARSAAAMAESRVADRGEAGR